MSRPTPSPESLQRYADGFNKSLTLRYFGAVVDFPSPTRIRVTLPIRPEHRGGKGSSAVNGGVIAAMVDLTIGSSAALVDPTRKSATMQLSMSFERGLLGGARPRSAFAVPAGLGRVVRVDDRRAARRGASVAGDLDRARLADSGDDQLVAVEPGPDPGVDQLVRD